MDRPTSASLSLLIGALLVGCFDPDSETETSTDASTDGDRGELSTTGGATLETGEESTGHESSSGESGPDEPLCMPAFFNQSNFDGSCFQ